MHNSLDFGGATAPIAPHWLHNSGPECNRAEFRPGGGNIRPAGHVRPAESKFLAL